MTKSFNEKIAETSERITQLENQKKQLIQKQKTEERKARTKRLIERGAILESLINGAENLTNEQIKIFLEKTVASDFGRRILANIAAQGGETTTAEPTTAAQGNTHTATQTEGNSAGQPGNALFPCVARAHLYTVPVSCALPGAFAPVGAKMGAWRSLACCIKV